MTALSDYLNEANRDRALSARAIAQLADPPISHSNVARVLRGDSLYPSDETLQSLASVLPVSIKKLRELAGTAAGEQQPYVPPSEANRLTFQQRRALDDLIRAFVGDDRPRGRGHRVTKAAHADTKARGSAR